MTILTVTSQGQVTLPKELLAHLGIQPGDRVELNLLPGGRAELAATRLRESGSQLYGIRQGKTNGSKLSIDEINESISRSRSITR